MTIVRRTLARLRSPLVVAALVGFLMIGGTVLTVTALSLHGTSSLTTPSED
ncbi:hypothetical protein ABZ319_05655 [Nocardia sp. NPDC005978]|uniref:hypothetical protein n=1 Tax=Nocardia sp. NPDC005978 TaxID=3156725 RepID=UPI0033A9AC29